MLRGQLRQLRGHAAAVHAVAWSPDGARLASAAEAGDGPLRLWDPQSGRCLAALEPMRSVRCVAYSPDGTRLACGGFNQLRVWDGDRWQTFAELDRHQRVLCVAWSPDGGRLAGGGEDGAAHIWDAHTGRRLLTLPHPPTSSGVSPTALTAPAWSPGATPTCGCGTRGRGSAS